MVLYSKDMFAHLQPLEGCGSSIIAPVLGVRSDPFLFALDPT